MTRHREHALVLLAAIRDKLAPGSPRPLTAEERRYLVDVCDAALADQPDPLGLDRGPGGQRKTQGGLAEARLVHQRVKNGETLRAACEAVGIESDRDGSKSGAVEKNYRAHRAVLEASDRIYAALAQRTPPSDDDIAIVLGK